MQDRPKKATAFRLATELGSPSEATVRPSARRSLGRGVSVNRLVEPLAPAIGAVGDPRWTDEVEKNRLS